MSFISQNPKFAHPTLDSCGHCLHSGFISSLMTCGHFWLASLSEPLLPLTPQHSLRTPLAWVTAQLSRQQQQPFLQSRPDYLGCTRTSIPRPAHLLSSPTPDHPYFSDIWCDTYHTWQSSPSLTCSHSFLHPSPSSLLGLQSLSLNVTSHFSKPRQPLPHFSTITRHFVHTSSTTLQGVCKLLVSLGHTGRRVVLGRALNTLWHVIIHTQKIS